MRLSTVTCSLKIYLEYRTHSMQEPFWIKIKFFLTSTIAASKYIPDRPRICINWNPPFQTQIYFVKVPLNVNIVKQGLFNKTNKYYIPAFKATLTGWQALPWKTLFNFIQDPLEHFSGLFSGMHHSKWLDEDTFWLSRHSWKLSTDRKAGGPIWDPVPRICESEIKSEIHCISIH